MFDIEAAATYKAMLAERVNDSLLIPMHDQCPSGKVAAAVSTGGGETWSDVLFVEEITEIFCQSDVVPRPTEDYPERMAFADISQMRFYRGRGILHLSKDGGRTRIISRTFNPIYYVYQCIMILSDRALGLLWERKMQGPYFSCTPLKRIKAVKI